MGVKCPRHNAELTIEHTSINMLGNKYPVVTGECPVCKVKYISREIMSSSGSFKIAGQTYEYLNEMETRYPYPHENKSKDKGGNLFHFGFLLLFSPVNLFNQHSYAVGYGK